MNPFFVLGADSLQMQAIEQLLSDKGVPYGFAVDDENNRVLEEPATRIITAPNRTARIADGQKVFTIECRVKGLNEAASIGHHPGDPGFDMTPRHFWAGSSMGQVVAWLEFYDYDVKITRHMQIVAATDFCFAAALRGGCPDITALEVQRCRFKELRQPHLTAAGMYAVIERWQKAFEKRRGRVYNATYLSHDLHICKLAEIAAVNSSRVLVIRQSLAANKHKVMLLGNVSPECALDFAEWCEAQERFTNIQCAPARGIASVILHGEWDELLWHNLDWLEGK